MMMKFSLLLYITLFIQSCTTAPQKHVTELMLPKKWQARSLKDKWGAQCAKPRAVGDEFWTFCHGKLSAHGSLMRMNAVTQTIEETLIPSRDPLAMSVSVTAESPWLIGAEKVWVGTEDGRILGFDFSGKLIESREFALHAWIQHLKLVDETILAVVSRYQQVALVKLDDDLDIDQSITLSETLQSVELLVQDERVVVATDKGFLFEFDLALKLQKTMELSPGVSLGEISLTSQGLYVGNEAGVLYHVNSQGEIKSIKKSASPISSAPVLSSQGLWVAYDEEGSLRLFDSELNLKKKLEVPFNRSLLGLKPMLYGQHLLLEVTSFGHVNLLSAEGEVLLSQEDLGALNWEITPSDVTDTLEATRSPAGQNR
jgi:outer membrane protein assembly factor BamB